MQNEEIKILPMSEESFYIFKKNTPKTIIEHVGITLMISGDTLNVSLNLDEEPVFYQTFPTFLFPKTYEMSMLENNLEENLFYVFFFEFGWYYNLAFELSQPENQSLIVYKEFYNLLNKTYKTFYGEDKELTPEEICLFSSIILSQSKDMFNGVEDDELFEDFNFWIASVKDGNINTNSAKLNLLTIPSINSTPT